MCDDESFYTLSQLYHCFCRCMFYYFWVHWFHHCPSVSNLEGKVQKFTVWSRFLWYHGHWGSSSFSGRFFFSSRSLITFAYLLVAFSLVSSCCAFVASSSSADGCGPCHIAASICSTFHSFPQSVGHPSCEYVLINDDMSCNNFVPLDCTKLYLLKAFFSSGYWGR